MNMTESIEYDWKIHNNDYWPLNLTENKYYDNDQPLGVNMTEIKKIKGNH